jgi:hypothetical protein
MPGQELVFNVHKDVRIKMGYMPIESRRRSAVNQVRTFMKHPGDNSPLMIRMARDMTFTKLLSEN